MLHILDVQLTTVDATASCQDSLPEYAQHGGMC